MTTKTTYAEIVARLRTFGEATIAAGAAEVFFAAADVIEGLQRDLADERRITDGLGEALRTFYENDEATNVEQLLEEWDESRGID